MSIAIAAYNNRIASLFESLDRFVFIHPPNYNIKDSTSLPVMNNSVNELIQLLKSNHIKILICGAIRGCTRHQIEAQQIKVIPWITGDIQNVAQAFVSDNLCSSAFLMPGCRNRGYQKRHQFRKGRQNY